MEGSSKVLFRRFEERDTEGIRSIYPQFFEPQTLAAIQGTEERRA